MEHQWLINAPIYVRKLHKCPVCGQQLQVDKREKIRQAGSAAAKEFKGHIISSRSPDGKVKVHWKEFWCDTCQRHFTIEEVKRHEGIPV